MKNISLSLILLLFFFVSGAQTPTKVLLEMTTATGCFHCPHGNHIIDSLARQQPDKVIVLRYQLPLSSYDPIYYQDSAEILRRAKDIFGDSLQYSLPGTYLNGYYKGRNNPEDYSSAIIDSVYQQPDHFQLILQHQLTPDYDSIAVIFTVTSDTIQQFLPGMLKGQLILMEDSIFYKTPPGNNGEKHFFFECRKFNPSQSGWDLPTSWTPGMSQTFRYAFPIPPYIYNLNNLYLIGFIQEKSTMHILQSVKDAQIKVPSYAGIDIYKSLDLLPYTCDTLISGASVYVKNMGENMLTSFKLLFTIDSRPFDTIPWSGALLPDSSVAIALPILKLGGDGHHDIKTRVILPNGHVVAESFANNFATGIEVNTIPDDPPIHEYFKRAKFPYKGWFIRNVNRDGNTWMQVNYPATPGNYKLTSLFLRPFTMMPGTINEFFLPELAVHQMSSMTLYFDVSHVGTGGIPDTLSVLMSNNCGTSWQEIYRKTGTELAYTNMPWPEWVGSLDDSTNTDAWKRQTVSVSGYAANSRIMIKFRYIHEEGNNFALRNLYMGPNVGIPEEGLSRITIYPNPTTGFLQIDPGSSRRLESVEVLNILGNKVLFSEENLKAGAIGQIDLTGKPAGIYLLRIATSEGLTTRKIILNR